MTPEIIIVIIVAAWVIWIYLRIKTRSPTTKIEPAESNLRPSSLEEFVGQDAAKAVLRAMTAQGRLSDHLLLVGPPGTGKTTLARIAAGTEPLATLIGGQLRTTQDAQKALALSNMLFIDEVHAASRKALEILYSALEDNQGWRLVAGTTDAGKLPAPFRDRFGYTIYLSYYTSEEIVQILRRTARLLGLKLRSQQLYSVARRSRGTPRVANALLRRVADCSSNGAVNLKEVWKLLDINTEGLTCLDRQVLEILRGSRKPMGLEQIARRTGVDTSTISGMVEPYLLRLGLMDITRGGRVAT